MSDLTPINKEKFIGDINRSISEYYKRNIVRISNPKFHDIMISDVTGKLIESYGFENFELLQEIVEEEHNELFDKEFMYLMRTCEHYIGNAYIIEFDQDEDNAVFYTMYKMAKLKESAYVHVDSCVPWVCNVGKMLYENETGAKIGESGRIQHPERPSIICEIDGIVENMESPLYGRIVKINNVQKKYNVGIPYEEEWIQLQMQMECCDLDFCDYVETQFGEYETEEEFFADKERTRGLILILEDNVGKIVYKCMPPIQISISVEAIKAWIETVYMEKYTFIKTIYWYLEKFEMTLVIRNKDWFDAVK